MEHDEVYQRITSILDGEDDWVTAMATVACELHNAFDHYHWTGFYRTTSPGLLKIGRIKVDMDVLSFLSTKASAELLHAQERRKTFQTSMLDLSISHAVQAPTVKSLYL